MRGLARAVVAAGLLATPAFAEGRLTLDRNDVPVDGLICVCADRAAPPVLLHLDGHEAAPPSLWARPAGGAAPRPIHLAMPWPKRGPLRLLALVPARGHVRELAMWGQDGTLGPGDYVLTANGFAAESLHVRVPDPSEERSRALLARARLHAEQGDSTLAARLLEQVADRKNDPYAEAATLAIGDVLPYSRYGEHPERWLVEWIARRHSACVVGEGIRVWLAHHDDMDGRVALARLVSRYPETRAWQEAQAWLVSAVPVAP
jgi:hypothetical protein